MLAAWWEGYEAGLSGSGTKNSGPWWTDLMWNAGELAGCQVLAEILETTLAYQD
jgi:hypothetical protein